MSSRGDASAAKPALAILVAWLAGCSAAAAASSTMRDAAPTRPPGPDEAKIVFYRPGKLLGNQTTWRIYDGETLAGVIENGASFEHRCPPGRHLFLAVPGTEPAVDADLAGGKTYYVRVNAKTGHDVSAELVPLTREDREFEACACRELSRERITEDYLAQYRKYVATWKAHWEGPGSKQCQRLRPEDGR